MPLSQARRVRMPRACAGGCAEDPMPRMHLRALDDVRLGGLNDRRPLGLLRVWSGQLEGFSRVSLVVLFFQVT